MLRERCREFLKEALHDSHLSNHDKSALEKTARSFALPDAIQQSIYKEEVLRVVQQVSAVQNQRFTANKRLLFNGLSKNCNVPYKKIITFTVY